MVDPGGCVQNWYSGLAQPVEVAVNCTVVPYGRGDAGEDARFAVPQWPGTTAFVVRLSVPSALVAVTVNL